MFAVGKAILARVQSHKHVGKDYLIGTRCGDRREWVENGSQVLFLKNFPKKDGNPKTISTVCQLWFLRLFLILKNFGDVVFFVVFLTSLLFG